VAVIAAASAIVMAAFFVQPTAMRGGIVRDDCSEKGDERQTL
jgi:hypothetical protein